MSQIINLERSESVQRTVPHISQNRSIVDIQLNRLGFNNREDFLKPFRAVALDNYVHSIVTSATTSHNNIDMLSMIRVASLARDLQKAYDAAGISHQKGNYFNATKNELGNVDNLKKIPKSIREKLIEDMKDLKRTLTNKNLARELGELIRDLEGHKKLSGLIKE